MLGQRRINLIFVLGFQHVQGYKNEMNRALGSRKYNISYPLLPIRAGALG